MKEGNHSPKGQGTEHKLKWPTLESGGVRYKVGAGAPDRVISGDLRGRHTHTRRCRFVSAVNICFRREFHELTEYEL